jgi:two-component system, cell cycle response regulator
MSSKLENSERRILAVDDDPESLRVLMKALEWDGYQVARASSGPEALRSLNDWKPQLVLLDVNMPGLNGIDTLSLLRKQTQYVSTIFVSADSNTADVIRGLDAGADDYICKPYDPQELLARIRCHLRIKDVRDELRRANERLKELVDRDDLTGLFNMRSLYQKLDTEIDRAHRYDRQVAVIMMDMDHFKQVNDQHDHLFGSHVLSEVGRLIRSNMRKVDIAARYGGDEFLIVLTEINADGAKIFAERLRKVILETEFSQGRYQKKLTASIGLAVTGIGGSGLDARSLVREADRALYSAKEQGRNRVVIKDLGLEPSMKTPVGKRLRK